MTFSSLGRILSTIWKYCSDSSKRPRFCTMCEIPYMDAMQAYAAAKPEVEVSGTFVVTDDSGSLLKPFLPDPHGFFQSTSYT